jgi:hypothetical protein
MFLWEIEEVIVYALILLLVHTASVGTQWLECEIRACEP